MMASVPLPLQLKEDGCCYVANPIGRGIQEGAYGSWLTASDVRY